MSSVTLTYLLKVSLSSQLAFAKTLICGSSRFRTLLFFNWLIDILLWIYAMKEGFRMYFFECSVMALASVISDSLELIVYPLLLRFIIRNLKQAFKTSRSSSILTVTIGLDSNDWSQLRVGVYSEIVNRLPAFEDFLVAAGFFRTCGFAFMGISIIVNAGKDLSMVYSSSSMFVLGLMTSAPLLISIIQPLMESSIGSRSSSLDHQFELCQDLVVEIVNRLPTFEDIMAVARVFRTWRSVCLNIGRGPQLPWLMLSETLSTDMRHFFSLYYNNRYQLRLPQVHEKRYWGSPHGWVVTLGPDYETHLLHLMKRVQIPLPPLNTIRTLAPIEEWFRLVHKFILLKDPSQDSSLLVIAIFGPVNRLAFARVAFDRGGEGAALNRRGQGQWAVVTNPDNLKFNDVTCFNDYICGLCDNGKLVRLELDAPLAAEVHVIAPQPSEEEVGTPQKLYLMNSSENLFAVFRYGFHIPSMMRHETIYFLVYKLNSSASAWEEVIDLDLAVFVGDGNSWCIPTSGILHRSNCIYFTDDNWEWQRYPGVAYGGHDVGVFNMAQRVIQRLPFGEDNPRFYSRPIWVTPTMLLDELYVC